MELRRQYLVKEIALPNWLQVVNGKILKADTPVHVRQLHAGDEQYRQSQTEALKLSDLAAHLLMSKEVKEDPEDWRRLAMALRKCGFDRAETPVCFLPLIAFLSTIGTLRSPDIRFFISFIKQFT